MLRTSLFEMWRTFPWSSIHCVPLGCLISLVWFAQCPRQKISLLEQDGFSAPRMSWSFSSSWEEPVKAVKSSLWPCPAEPGGDGEQPFPAPPCQWEDFCHRLDGCRMETLIFKEGMTQISKSYRPWNKLLFLAFEAFWYGKTQFHCKIFQSTKLLPKFLLPQSAVSHTCDGHSSQIFKLPLWSMEMKVMSEHIIPFLVGAWEYLLWPDTCTADVDVWWWRHPVPCLFTPAITNYKRNEWVF